MSRTGPKKKRSDVRNQHYVPRCLMNPFAKKGGGKKLQVHVFDKRTDRSFITATENIFAQRDFNTFEGADGTVLCLEDGMPAIEDIAAPVLRKLVKARSLAAISTNRLCCTPLRRARSSFLEMPPSCGQTSKIIAPRGTLNSA